MVKPHIMIKKPNGKHRFCLDFRKIKSLSKKDAYQLLNINGILDKLHAARHISTSNLNQVYFRIQLPKKSREISV